MSGKKIFQITLTFIFVLLLSSPVLGAGFALYEGSARGNVLGAGLTASADDASALFYNPAGITQLKGIQTQIGVTAITPMVTVDTPGASTDMERNWFFPPHAYITYQINDSWWTGVGVFSRFGLGTEFPANWPGRYNSTRAMIKETEINPNIAWKVNEKFSLAAGVAISYFNLDLSSKLLPVAPFGVPETDFNLSGDSWGYGFNLAAHYKPFEWMQAGITYRSKIDQQVKGTATMTPSTPVYPTNSAQGGISLPDMIFAGLNFNVTKALSVGGGVYWTGWEKYDNLQVYFTRPLGGTTTSISSPKNWKNVARYMIASEWKATENWDLRLGYAYDTAPEPETTVDYILPDNDRHIFSIGAGYHRAAWSVDLSYSYYLILDRSYIGTAGGGAAGTLPGKVTDGNAHVIGLTFGYKF